MRFCRKRIGNIEWITVLWSIIVIMMEDIESVEWGKVYLSKEIKADSVFFCKMEKWFQPKFVFSSSQTQWNQQYSSWLRLTVCVFYILTPPKTSYQVPIAKFFSRITVLMQNDTKFNLHSPFV